MSLTEWARRLNIPQAALDDLTRLSVAGESSKLSEAGVQSRVRLEAARKNLHLWRNNCGAGRIEDGRFIRWGLANDSAQLSERLKSADLIGIRPILITPAMVGQTVGQFVSRECKHGNWKPDGSDTYKAQLAWATLINLNGGDAKIVTSEGSL